jgi:hypothetical protein
LTACRFPGTSLEEEARPVKDRKKRRHSLDPDAVIAGRVHPSAEDLVALIHERNPTGRGLPPHVAASRYKQKSRLQSLLVARFKEEIDVRAAPNEPGVVSLHHRASGLDACHAPIADLDEEVRSWVQFTIDTAASAAPSSPAPVSLAPRAESSPLYTPPASRASRAPRDARPPTGAEDLRASELVSAGKEAMLAFDYDEARRQFEAALARSGGGAEPAGLLLSLLVEHLALDKEALAVEPSLSAEARADPLAGVLLALAAARSGGREDALRRMKELRARRSGLFAMASRAAPSAEPHPGRAAEVFIALARRALEAGQFVEASEDLAKARERGQEPVSPRR